MQPASGQDKNNSELHDIRKGLIDTRLPSKKMQHKRPEEFEAKEKAKVRALLRFKTTEEAHRAVRQLNNTYVTNECIQLRVLH